jgi:hypothetical protein
MATLVSKAGYAKLHGKSPQAAAKWETKGALVFRDGKVLVEASDQNMQHAGLGRFAIASTAPTTGASTINHQGPSTEPLVDGAGIDPTDDEALEGFAEALLAGRYATLIVANQVKENALALKRLLEAKREAGRLVEIEVAEQVIFEEFRAARDAWANFPSRIGALLAAELGVDADLMIEGLTTHVQRHLEELGEPEPDFFPVAQEGDA